ncbi:MAG TPA: acyl-CoA carboxylase subunit epsilon [Aeromicrobium sp.]|nr:acyl-CoA carboxylase subunit epsilon [Aeromicrobium sp.]
MADETEPKPLLRVVKGDPSPEELAALVAVIAARSSAPVRRRRTRSEWGHPAHQMRGMLRRGPDAWHRSAFGG